MTPPPINGLTSEENGWPEALATVTACQYEFGAGRALAFGTPTNKHFRISYNYFVAGEIHTGEFTSAQPIPQGQLFPIRYNPNAPHQNSHDGSKPSVARGSRLIVGLIGSAVLSLVWFAVLRGCH